MKRLSVRLRRLRIAANRNPRHGVPLFGRATGKPASPPPLPRRTGRSELRRRTDNDITQVWYPCNGYWRPRGVRERERQRLVALVMGVVQHRHRHRLRRLARGEGELAARGRVVQPRHRCAVARRVTCRLPATALRTTCSAFVARVQQAVRRRSLPPVPVSPQHRANAKPERQTPAPQAPRRMGVWDRFPLHDPRPQEPEPELRVAPKSVPAFRARRLRNPAHRKAANACAAPLPVARAVPRR